jgi:hypothetical protein
VFAFFDDGESTRCVFRTGPRAGASTIAGHMHADLLSIGWVHRGRALLVDPGTYSYRFRAPGDAEGTERWREHFAGPLAHNGIVVDGEDPLGPVAGDFRPGSSSAAVVQTIVRDGEDLAIVEAAIVSPSRYASVTRGVVHVRGEYFVAYGVLEESAAAREVLLPLQLDHRARIVAEDDCTLTLATGDGAAATLVFSDDLLLSARRSGERDPPRGWVSLRYGEIAPATQLEFRLAAGRRSAAFVLGANVGAPVRSVETRFCGTTAFALALRGAEFCDYVLLNRGPADAALSAFGIDFRGRAAWLRVSASAKRIEVRAVDAIRCTAPELAIDLDFGTYRGEARHIVGGT